jgi:hypothetical protein
VHSGAHTLCTQQALIYCVLPGEPGDPAPTQLTKKPQAVLGPTFIVLVDLPLDSSMTGLLRDIYIYTYVHTDIHHDPHSMW